MHFSAIVENNVIKLPPGLHFPDGAYAFIELLRSPRQATADEYLDCTRAASESATAEDQEVSSEV